MTAVLPVREPGAAAQLPPAGDKRSAAGLAGTARRIVGLRRPVAGPRTAWDSPS